MNIGSNIKSARKAAGLRQVDMAELLNVTANYIAQIESGRKRPSLKLVSEVSSKLKVRMADLLIGDEYMSIIRRELETEFREKHKLEFRDELVKISKNLAN